VSITPSPLERWFTTHPGPHHHSLASTCAGAPAWDEVLPLLPAGWERAIELGYAEPEGDPALRELVAAEYGLPSRHHVLLTQGAVEANWLALAAVVRPGMRVVVQAPIYPQLPLVAEHLGATVIPWRQPWDEPPLGDLLVLNAPHNPTGFVFPHLEGIISKARAANCLVLMDEVYRGVGEGPVGPSALAWGHEGVLVSCSMSKALALPGLRVGWLAGDEKVIAQAVPWREHTTLALAGPATALARAIWPRRGELVAANHAILARNRARIAGIGEAPPTAGVALIKHDRDVEVAERWYGEQRGLVIPGTVCGLPGHFRVGFGHRDPSALEAALMAFLPLL
jgi:aspartate/methionine/tyrosine aminotransferase